MGECLKLLEAPVLEVAWSKDGQRIMTQMGGWTDRGRKPRNRMLAVPQFRT